MRESYGLPPLGGGGGGGGQGYQQQGFGGGREVRAGAGRQGVFGSGGDGGMNTSSGVWHNSMVFQDYSSVVAAGERQGYQIHRQSAGLDSHPHRRHHHLGEEERYDAFSPTRQEMEEERIRMEEDRDVEGDFVIVGEHDYGHDQDEASVDAWLSGSGGTFGVGSGNRGGARGVDLSSGAGTPLNWGEGRGTMGSIGYDSLSAHHQRQYQQHQYQHPPNATYLPSFNQSQSTSGTNSRWISPAMAQEEFTGANVGAGGGGVGGVSRSNDPWAFDPAVMLMSSRGSPLRSQAQVGGGFHRTDDGMVHQSQQQQLPSLAELDYPEIAMAPIQQQAEYEIEQEPQPPLQAGPNSTVDDPVSESGLELHTWLAESVWNFCTTPYLPGKPCSPQRSPKAAASYAPSSYDSYGNKQGKQYGMADGYNNNNQNDANGTGMSDWFETYSDQSVHISPPLTPSPAMLYHNPYGLRSSPSSSFISFVHRTLSQTLLSPSAVILSLWYIRRLAIHAGGGQDGVALRRMLMESVTDLEGRGGEEGARRVLTLGLACSNKWLDDNTFTNKSW